MGLRKVGARRTSTCTPLPIVGATAPPITATPVQASCFPHDPQHLGVLCTPQEGPQAQPYRRGLFSMILHLACVWLFYTSS